MTRAIALWLSGYDKSLSDAVQLSPVERSHMALVGTGVGLSCMMALSSGALASTWVTAGLPAAIQIAIAVATGVALAAFVLVLDRAVIIAAEHRPTGQTMRWIWLVRAGIILAVSSSTLLKIAPSFIGSALAAQAADEREHRDNERRGNLIKQFNVKGISDDEASSANRINALHREMEAVPADIDRSFTDASNCFVRVASMRQRLIDSNVSQGNATIRTAAQRAVCTGIHRRAEVRLTTYRTDLRADLEAERNRAATLRAQQVTANAAVSERTADGRNSDRETITQSNLAMLTKLITSDPMAMAELLALWVVLAIFDGAGLIIKASIGRTQAGERIGVERGIAQLDAKARFEVAKLEHSESIAMRGAFGESMIDTLGSVETRDSIKREFARIAVATAPLAAAALAANEAEEHAASIERSIRRSPRLAGLLAKLMAGAIDMASRNFASIQP